MIYQPLLIDMSLMTRILAMLIAVFPMTLVMNAQDDEFDLLLQRSESQNIKSISGERLTNGGIVLNPVPQHIAFMDEGYVDISKGIVFVDVKGKFRADLDFVPKVEKGLKLIVDYGSKSADKHNVEKLPGAYVLNVTARAIMIAGYDEQGAFYGIQTLRQLVESPACAGGKLPFVSVSDWPDLRYRGVVEGFYGEPWSHQVRLSLIDFYGRNKMNCYIYGPKDDPYHSSPSWRFPYPEKQASEIKELVAACKRNRVDFIWAIHPGKDIKWNDEDYKFLLNKFILMYYLGVRSFALFFDDISGEGTDPVRQVDLVNRLNADFISIKKDVKPLILCPTDYSKLWADPSPEGSLSIYGRTMDPSVKILWTGDFVCSDLTKETMTWVNDRIRRPGFYWWNYPVTDYARHILMQGPVYGLDGTMTSEDLAGFVSNPMEHGEASKLALYGVADYTWNVGAYNPIDNWERGLEELAPEVKDAYRTFAIHSCDTETGYRRVESWETETFTVESYSDEKYAAMLEEFKRIETVPDVMARCSNKMLLEELRPWLVEFGKLGLRGRKALECLKILREGDHKAFWNSYVCNLMTDADRQAYNAHKSGTQKLQPFYENLMNDMAAAFYEELSGKAFLRPDTSIFMKLKGKAEYQIPADAERCVVLFKSAPVENTVVRQLGSDGSLIVEIVPDGAFVSMDIKDGAVIADILGEADIFEVIFTN